MPKHAEPETHRRSASEWRKIVGRWERSGQSAEEFADENRLSRQTLIWWRWRLRRRATPPRASAPTNLTFVPLLARPAQESSGEPHEARWVIEADGVRVAMSGSSALLVDGLGVALERLRRKA